LVFKRIRKLDRMMWRLAQIVGAAVLVAFSARLAANMRFLRRVQRAHPLPDTPLVSILVPARDERASIAACIVSLARQDYPRYEIIVLDDQSTDGTGPLLDRLAGRVERLRVIHGIDSPPPGWNGKSYACQRLAEQARGDWLLFTDADTQHTPHSLRLGMAQAAALSADLLTAFPYQETQTWAERVMVPFIMDFLPLVGLDFHAIWQGSAGMTAANGQYMLVRRESYDAVGGHAAIARERVDDFALARALYRRGYTVGLVSGATMLRCRMYHSAGEVWRGFSKNLMLGLDTSAAGSVSGWQAPVFAFAYASVFVLPFVGLFRHGERVVSAALLLWLTGLRAAASLFLRRSLLESLATLPAAWGVMALGLNALAGQRRGRAVVWKGRVYQEQSRS